LLILGLQLWWGQSNPEGIAHNFLLGWQPSHFFQLQFENADVFFSYSWPNAVFYAQPAGHPAYIFPLLGLTSLWGVWHLWQIRQWGILTLCLGWIGPAYLFLSGIPFQNFRFGLTYYLPLVILVGFGLSDLLSIPPLFIPRFRRDYVMMTLNLIIVISLFGMLAWAYPMLDDFLTAQNHSKTIARQVAQRVPPQATLITFGLTLTLQHYTDLKVQELFYLDQANLATLTTTRRPLFLLIDPQNMETQWQDQPFYEHYRWLKEQTTLRELEAFPPYILFEIVSKTSELNLDFGPGADGGQLIFDDGQHSLVAAGQTALIGPIFGLNPQPHGGQIGQGKTGGIISR
jgi:hypothetical protein